MQPHSPTFSPRLPALLLVLAAGPLAAGPDEPAKPWRNQTEFSIAGTDGNAQSHSWGFSDAFSYRHAGGDLEIKLSAVRIDAVRFERRAVGTTDDWVLVEDTDTVKTAENQRFALKYNRQWDTRAYWFGACDWNADPFAGIKSRASLSAGLGHKWLEAPSLRFKTDYGLQYTEERPLLRTPDTDRTFASLRLGYAFSQKVGRGARFKQELKAETNLAAHEDFLAVLTNQLRVGINDHLALRVGGELRYDNVPAFVAVDLYDTPTDTGAVGTVPFQKDSLDTTVTTGLVLQF